MNTVTGQTVFTNPQVPQGNLGQVLSGQGSGVSLAPGQSLAAQTSFFLPTGAAGVGLWSVNVLPDDGFTIDVDDDLLVTGYPEITIDGTADNNRSASVSFSSTVPDLHATGLTVDPSSVLQSGGNVTVDWSDSNVGSGPAKSPWTDDVTVVNTTTGATLASANVVQSPPGGSLTAGQSTPGQFTFALPDGAAGVGSLQITVLPDPTNALLDSNSNGTTDTNRGATISATSNLALYPDLHPTSVARPTECVAVWRNRARHWNDSNIGTAPRTDRGPIT